MVEENLLPSGGAGWGARVPADLCGLSPLGLGGTRESVTVDEYRTVMRAHMKAAFDDPWVCR